MKSTSGKTGIVNGNGDEVGSEGVARFAEETVGNSPNIPGANGLNGYLRYG